MQADTEKTIIASWLMGDHLEDTELFHPIDFTAYRDLANAIMKGTTDVAELHDITRTPYSVLADITASYAPSYYEVAVGSMGKRMAERWITEHKGASPEEISEAMEMFKRKQPSRIEPRADPLKELLEEFAYRRNTPFVSTGLSDLDRMLKGIRRKELTAVGARPSVGKSAFCQQIAMEVAKQGEKVLYFPLEMSTVAMTERMFARFSDVPQYEIVRGLSDEVRQDPRTQVAFDSINSLLKSGNLLFFERCNDLEDIREMVAKHKPFLIIIDQLEQLKDGNYRWQDKRSRFSHMTHELQGLAMDMDVAVWLACQINRSADNSMPTMANLKESGTIEEDSDNVILLHRENEDKPAIQSISLTLAKQRQGECGTIPLAFNAPRYLFRGVTNRQE